ncbi:MAG: glycosyltransferase family 2 protein [Armatimonadota bacterium]
MDISVCIVSWNVAADLRACLQSLENQRGDVGFEIIVADNASTDGSPDLVARDFPGATLIRGDRNLGFARACNIALNSASGRYLLLLNPDCLLPEDGLLRLMHFADEHPDAGLVGPRLVNSDGSLQYSARRLPSIKAAILRNTFLGRLFPGSHAVDDYLLADWDHGSAREVDWLSGACLLVRRSALKEVGLLDEGFFWGSEDVDLAIRMKTAGWRVLYTPEPTVVHAIGRSTDRVPWRTLFRTHRSMFRLYRKHLTKSPLHTLVVWLGVWLRATLIAAQTAWHIFWRGWLKVARCRSDRGVR